MYKSFKILLLLLGTFLSLMFNVMAKQQQLRISANNSSKNRSFIKELKLVNRPSIQSTSESSIDSQSSTKELLKNHGWSKKSHEFFQNPSKKNSYLEHPIHGNKNQSTFILRMMSVYFSSYSMEQLDLLVVKPRVSLTWTFLELQDTAYSTVLPTRKAIFNCSPVYRGDITRAMLRYMCSNRVKVECHVVLEKTNEMINCGEIDVSDAIHHPNTKCKYKVCLDGPNNVTAVISCLFKLYCPQIILREVLRK